MSYSINIQAGGYTTINTKTLTHAISNVLQDHHIEEDSELSVVVTDNDTVRKLNYQHRHIDAPTDILSFPADPLPDFMIDEPNYLGDLIIAYPYTENIALNKQLNLNDVLSLLVIHGTLHLLGYDHDTPENTAEMWSAQAKALENSSINANIVSQYGDIDDA